MRMIVRSPIKRVKYFDCVKAEPAQYEDEKQEHKKELIIDRGTAKTGNDLARKQFITKLLKDILFDLTVCEIEGLDKLEYIKELQYILSSITIEKPRNERHCD